jgi:hypothetical protein
MEEIKLWAIKAKAPVASDASLLFGAYSKTNPKKSDWFNGDIIEEICCDLYDSFGNLVEDIYEDEDEDDRFDIFMQDVSFEIYPAEDESGMSEIIYDDRWSEED